MKSRMQDDSDEIKRVIQLHDMSIAAFNVDIQTNHDTNVAIHIIDTLFSMLKDFADTENSFKLWLWGSIAKFFSKQSSCHFDVQFQEKMALILDHLFLAIVKANKDVNKDAKFISKISQLLVVIIKIAARNSLLTISNSITKSIQIGLPFDSLDEETKTKLRPILDNLPKIDSNKKAISFEQPLIVLEPKSGISLEQPLFDLSSLTMNVLLDQLPSFLCSLTRNEFKMNISRLVRLSICADKKSALKSILEGCLLKSFMNMPNNYASDLFSKCLAEQIYISTIFPFSYRPGSEVFGRELFGPLTALWKLMNDSECQEISLIIKAIRNLFLEGVLDVSKINQILELLKATKNLNETCIVDLIVAMLSICSFRHVNDIFELLKKFSPSINIWKIISIIGVSKLPDVIYSRVSEILIPLVEVISYRNWVEEHFKLSHLEVYARYSSNLNIFEMSFLASDQNEFLKFYQKQSTNLESSCFALKSIEYTYVIDDPMSCLIKRLELLLKESDSRRKYQKSLQSLLDLCGSDVKESGGGCSRSLFMFRHELENYLIEKDIGHGSFATVYKGRDIKTGKAVAVKAINSERLNKKLSENLATEISVMKDFKSEHIVELYDLQRSGKFIYLVMEYCNKGDLADLLRKKLIIEEEQVCHLVKQLGEALRVLFKSNFAHRDLKPQNILLLQDDQEEGLKLKLGDFGFARFVDPADMAETLCGSPLYMAPEILRYEKYDGKADLWSVGAIMYEMLFGKPPFKAQNHIQLLKVIERTEVIFPQTIYLSDSDPEHKIILSETCKELILGLLKKNPNERLSFDDFITHPFFDLKPKHEPVGKVLMTDPIVLRKGFKPIRQRSASFANTTFVPSSFKALESQLSASLKASNTTSATTTTTTTSTNPTSNLSTISLKVDQDQERLLSLLSSIADIRPALIKLIQRDTRLALILKDLTDQNSLHLDRSTTFHVKNTLLETFKLLQMATDLIQNLLKLIKESSAFKPSDDNSRALVLWLYNKAEDFHEKLSLNQKQLDDLSVAQSTGLSITSSSVISTSDSPSIVSDLIYNHALKLARDGGLQELLGHQTDADYLYRQAIFMLEILSSPTRPNVFLEHNEPALSQQDNRIIQGCLNVIQQRCNALIKSPK